MTAPTLLERLRRTRIVVVVTIDHAEDASMLATVLLDSGIDVMEVTLRTSAAIDAVKAIKEQVPQMTIGAGTILTPHQVESVVAAGAAFGVGPGLNPHLIKAARAAGLPFIPGVLTPTEVEKAIRYDCRLLKFFPAEPIGGAKYLAAMAAPYAHLHVGFIPLGGVNLTNMAAYLTIPSCPAIGGSWIANRECVRRHDWNAIAGRAREAHRLSSRYAMAED